MGFGLCSLGFLLLTTDSIGLDFLGYALIASGFLRVSGELRDYRGYRAAAAAALAALPVSLLSLYSFLTRLTAFPELPESVMAAKSVYLLLAGVAVCAGYCLSTARIAGDGGARFFAFRARATLCISALCGAASAAALIFGAPGAVSAVLLVLRLLVPIFNAALLFTCFTTITTKRRAAEEERLVKEEMQITERKRSEKRGNSARRCRAREDSDDGNRAEEDSAIEDSDAGTARKKIPQ